MEKDIISKIESSIERSMYIIETVCPRNVNAPYQVP